MRVELKHREEYKVDFDALDFTGKLSLYGLSGYMQIIAANHASIFGVNFYKNLDNPSYYWIVSKVKYVMNRYPKWEDVITLETYPGGYDKLYAVRKFDIYDQSDNQLGYIIGDYILMDMERKRPVQIKGSKGALSILDFPYEGEKLAKIRIPEEVIKSEIRKAYYSEMDLNGHMNNSHYVKWALDMLPIEYFKTHEVRSLEINYNAAIEYGAEVKMHLGRNEADKYIVYGNTLDDAKNYFTAAIELAAIK